MTLKLFNTLNRRIEIFEPKTDNVVNLYTCGPTVYDYLTIGNWVSYITWDILVRVLITNDYEVNRAMNITDVGHLVSDGDDGQDKLEKGAKREGKSAWDIASFYTEDFLTSMKSLNLIIPSHIIRATDYISQQLELLRSLKKQGYTYQIDDGIYFDCSKFPSYANFAKLDLDGQKAGARVIYNPQKRQSYDFALWKFTQVGEKRDMQWLTPNDLVITNEDIFGFPGWHLECSAIAKGVLGDTLDIHTGGIDHIAVHHTNEIAQSEAANKVQLSRYWLHNNHMMINGTKISKSLGNGYTLADIIKHDYSLMEYKLFVLQSHYRSESNFTFENLLSAKNRLNNWYNIACLRHQIHDTIVKDKEKETSLRAAPQAILEALNNDLNTPEALHIIDKSFSKLTDIETDKLHYDSFVKLIKFIDQVLGLNLINLTPDISDENKIIILARQRARENQDWNESDKLRDQLLKNNISVKDTSNGPIWNYTKYV